MTHVPILARIKDFLQRKRLGLVVSGTFTLFVLSVYKYSVLPIFLSHEVSTLVFDLSVVSCLMLGFIVWASRWVADLFGRSTKAIDLVIRSLANAFIVGTGFFMSLIVVNLFGIRFGGEFLPSIVSDYFSRAYFASYSFVHMMLYPILFLALALPGYREWVTKVVERFLSPRGVSTPHPGVREEARTTVGIAMCLSFGLSSLIFLTNSGRIVSTALTAGRTDRPHESPDLPGLITPPKPPPLTDVPTVENLGPIKLRDAVPAVQRWGNIEGSFVYNGREEQRMLIAKAGSHSCNELDIFQPEFRTFKSNDDSPRIMEDVVVWLVNPTAVHDRVSSQVRSTNLINVKISKCEAVYPSGSANRCGVVVLRPGDKLEITNEDAVPHILKTSLRANAFTCKLEPGQSVLFQPTHREEHPGVIFCDLFKWIRFNVLIIDSPYFEISRYFGFQMRDVPAGWQKLAAWHPLTGYLTSRQGADLLIEGAEPGATHTDMQKVGEIDITDKFDKYR